MQAEKRKEWHPRVKDATPWGNADHVCEVAEGVYRVDTPSHGGYWLSAARWSEFKTAFPKFQSFTGPQWLEEDCDWCAVFVMWPELAIADAGNDERRADEIIYHAVQTWRGEHKEQGEVPAVVANRAAMFAERNKDNYIIGSSGGGWGTPSGYVEASFRHLTTGERRCALIASDVFYANRSQFWSRSQLEIADEAAPKCLDCGKSFNVVRYHQRRAQESQRICKDCAKAAVDAQAKVQANPAYDYVGLYTPSGGTSNDD